MVAIKVDTDTIRNEPLGELTRAQVQMRRDEVHALVEDMRGTYAANEAFAAKHGHVWRAPVKQPDGSVKEMTAAEGFAHFKDTLDAYETLLARIDRHLGGTAS